MSIGTPPRRALRPPAPPGRPRAADQSMSLLRDVTALSLDPGYRRAKEAEREGARPPAPAWRAVILLIAVLLGCATVWAIRELRVPAPQAAQNREALVSRIEQGTEQVQELQTRSEGLQAEVADLQRTVVDVPLSDQLDELSLAAAQTPVRGPGLRLTMQDAASVSDPDVGTDPRDASELDQGRVLDRDLQVVVNALWAAGAEAISINGDRLSGLSAIRGAGEAVLVDFKPLLPPYEISAVGDAAQMQSRFAGNGGGDYVAQLREFFGIETSMAAVEQLDLPAAGQPSLRWTTSLAPAGTATPQGSDSQPPNSEENP